MKYVARLDCMAAAAGIVVPSAPTLGERAKVGTLNRIQPHIAWERPSSVVQFGLALCLLCLLVTSSSAQVVPSNIEPERVRPQTKIELPKIETVPDAVDILFEPQSWPSDRSYPMVHVRIPKAPHFAKTASSGPSRAYDLYIRMFYPNFSGFGDPENAECLADARVKSGYWGHCRREMSVGIQFLSVPDTYEALLHRNLERDVQKGYIKPLPTKSKYAGLELVGEQGGIRTTYYRSENTQGQSEYIFECGEHNFSPFCYTHFRATKSPYIAIRLGFVMALLPQWREVVTATRDRVDGMIVQTYYLNNKE